MREGDGVEVADDRLVMAFQCPYCNACGFTVKAKLFTPSDGKFECSVCNEISRTKVGFLFAFASQLAFLVGAIGALWLTFQIGPYFSLAILSVYLFGLFALGRVFALVWRLDATYRAGVKFGTFFARVFGRAKQVARKKRSAFRESVAEGLLHPQFAV